jgi:hypothetical protein
LLVLIHALGLRIITQRKHDMLDINQLLIISDALQSKIERLEAIIRAADEVIEDRSNVYVERWRIKLQRHRSTLAAVQKLIHEQTIAHLHSLQEQAA